MTSPFDDMERTFERFFRRGWLGPFRWEFPPWPEISEPFEGRMPSVDIIDRDDEILVHAELPGVEKDDLEVTLKDDTVTIKATTKREAKEEKGDYYRCEISRGAFSRTLTLPSDVDTEKAEATFKNGILELKMPKVEKVRKRSVPIK
ncbi:MAG: Hsp20/alpha crystallin family protein [Pseudomonadota bacterium]